MPDITADGAKGGAGGQGFDFVSPAGQGIPGDDAHEDMWDDDCATNGGPGGPGVQGGIGGPGGPGAHGGLIDIEVNSFSALIKLSAKGGEGGDGGKGGKGQDGGTGGNGGNGMDVELGLHGGNGGPGGNTGIGGPGGPGGNGGTIVVRTKNVADGNKSTMNPDAGAGGRGGDPGAAGLPGSPGGDGATTGDFSISSDCADRGPVPQWGAPGTLPLPPPGWPPDKPWGGSLGNGPSGSRGTAQFLQIQ